MSRLSVDLSAPWKPDDTWMSAHDAICSSRPTPGVSIVGHHQAMALARRWRRGAPQAVGTIREKDRAAHPVGSPSPPLSMSRHGVDLAAPQELRRLVDVGPRRDRLNEAVTRHLHHGHREAVAFACPWRRGTPVAVGMSPVSDLGAPLAGPP